MSSIVVSSDGSGASQQMPEVSVFDNEESNSFSLLSDDLDVSQSWLSVPSTSKQKTIQDYYDSGPVLFEPDPVRHDPILIGSSVDQLPSGSSDDSVVIPVESRSLDHSRSGTNRTKDKPQKPSKKSPTSSDKNVSKRVRVACPFCLKILGKPSLRRHIQIFHNNQQHSSRVKDGHVSCPFCSLQFASDYALSNHRMVAHSDPSGPAQNSVSTSISGNCTYCSFTMPISSKDDAQRFGEHLSEHIRATTNDVVKIPCVYCSASIVVDSPGALRDHYSKHLVVSPDKHTRKFIAERLCEKPVSSQIVPESRNKVQCIICNEAVSNDLMEMRIHQITKHSVNCSYCSLKITFSLFKQHLKEYCPIFKTNLNNFRLDCDCVAECSVCAVCRTVLNDDIQDQRKHMLEHKLTVRAYGVCTFCMTVSKTYAQFVWHLRARLYVRHTMTAGPQHAVVSSTSSSGEANLSEAGDAQSSSMAVNGSQLNDKLSLDIVQDPFRIPPPPDIHLIQRVQAPSSATTGTTSVTQKPITPFPESSRRQLSLSYDDQSVDVNQKVTSVVDPLTITSTKKNPELDCAESLPMSTEKRKYLCDLCGYPTDTFELFYSHMKNEHSAELNKACGIPNYLPAKESEDISRVTQSLSGVSDNDDDSSCTGSVGSDSGGQQELNSPETRVANQETLQQSFNLKNCSVVLERVEVTKPYRDCRGLSKTRCSSADQSETAASNSLKSTLSAFRSVMVDSDSSSRLLEAHHLRNPEKRDRSERRSRVSEFLRNANEPDVVYELLTHLPAMVEERCPVCTLRVEELNSWKHELYCRGPDLLEMEFSLSCPNCWKELCNYQQMRTHILDEHGNDVEMLTVTKNDWHERISDFLTHSDPSKVSQDVRMNDIEDEHVKDGAIRQDIHRTEERADHGSIGRSGEDLPSLLDIPPINGLPEPEGKQCPVCQATMSTERHARGHILEHHATQYLGCEVKLICPGCTGERGLSPHGLYAHLYVFHKDNEVIMREAQLSWRNVVRSLNKRWRQNCGTFDASKTSERAEGDRSLHVLPTVDSVIADREMHKIESSRKVGTQRDGMGSNAKASEACNLNESYSDLFSKMKDCAVVLSACQNPRKKRDEKSDSCKTGDREKLSASERSSAPTSPNDGKVKQISIVDFNDRRLSLSTKKRLEKLANLRKSREVKMKKFRRTINARNRDLKQIKKLKVSTHVAGPVRMKVMKDGKFELNAGSTKPRLEGKTVQTHLRYTSRGDFSCLNVEHYIPQRILRKLTVDLYPNAIVRSQRIVGYKCPVCESPIFSLVEDYFQHAKTHLVQSDRPDVLADVANHERSDVHCADVVERVDDDVHEISSDEDVSVVKTEPPQRPQRPWPELLPMTEQAKFVILEMVQDNEVGARPLGVSLDNENSSGLRAETVAKCEERPISDTWRELMAPVVRMDGVAQEGLPIPLNTNVLANQATPGESQGIGLTSKELPILDKKLPFDLSQSTPCESQGQRNGQTFEEQHNQDKKLPIQLKVPIMLDKEPAATVQLDIEVIDTSVHPENKDAISLEQEDKISQGLEDEIGNASNLTDPLPEEADHRNVVECVTFTKRPNNEPEVSIVEEDVTRQVTEKESEDLSSDSTESLQAQSEVPIDSVYVGDDEEPYVVQLACDDDDDDNEDNDTQFDVVDDVSDSPVEVDVPTSSPAVNHQLNTVTNSIPSVCSSAEMGSTEEANGVVAEGGVDNVFIGNGRKDLETVTSVLVDECPLCREKVSSNLMEVHFRSRHEISSLVCTCCRIQFADFKCLGQHISQITETAASNTDSTGKLNPVLDNMDISCPFCNECAESYSDLVLHITSMHCEQGTCPFCEDQFDNQSVPFDVYLSSAKSHISAHVNRHDSGESRPKIVSTGIMGSADVPPPDVSADVEENSDHEDPDVPRFFKCLYCDKTYRQRNKRDKHMLLVHRKAVHANALRSSSKKIQCPYCSMCTGVGWLFRHIMQRHGDIRPLICPQCKRSFTSPSTIRRHLKFGCEEMRLKVSASNSRSDLKVRKLKSAVYKRHKSLENPRWRILKKSGSRNHRFPAVRPDSTETKGEDSGYQAPIENNSEENRVHPRAHSRPSRATSRLPKSRKPEPGRSIPYIPMNIANAFSFTAKIPKLSKRQRKKLPTADLKNATSLLQHPYSFVNGVGLFLFMERKDADDFSHHLVPLRLEKSAIMQSGDYNGVLVSPALIKEVRSLVKETDIAYLVKCRVFLQQKIVVQVQPLVHFKSTFPQLQAEQHAARQLYDMVENNWLDLRNLREKIFCDELVQKMNLVLDLHPFPVRPCSRVLFNHTHLSKPDTLPRPEEGVFVARTVTATNLVKKTVKGAVYSLPCGSKIKSVFVEVHFTSEEVGRWKVDPASKLDRLFLAIERNGKKGLELYLLPAEAVDHESGVVVDSVLNVVLKKVSVKKDDKVILCCGSIIVKNQVLPYRQNCYVGRAVYPQTGSCKNVDEFASNKFPVVGKVVEPEYKTGGIVKATEHCGGLEPRVGSCENAPPEKVNDAPNKCGGTGSDVPVPTNEPDAELIRRTVMELQNLSKDSSDTAGTTLIHQSRESEICTEGIDASVALAEHLEGDRDRDLDCVRGNSEEPFVEVVASNTTETKNNEESTKELEADPVIKPPEFVPADAIDDIDDLLDVPCDSIVAENVERRCFSIYTEPNSSSVPAFMKILLLPFAYLENAVSTKRHAVHVVCTWCDKKYDSKDQGLNQGSGSPRTRCFCGVQFDGPNITNGASRLMNHCRNVHYAPFFAGKWPCRECQNSCFTSQLALKTHQKYAHQMKNRKLAPKRVRAVMLRQIMKIFMQNTQVEVQNPLVTMDLNVLSCEDFIMVATELDFFIPGKDRLAARYGVLRSSEITSVYGSGDSNEKTASVCSICGSKCGRDHKLKVHGGVEVEATLKCSECDELFLTTASLESHVPCFPKKTWRCQKCLMEFDERNQLMAHSKESCNEENENKKNDIVVVKSRKPRAIPCRFCGKMFTDSSSYDNHKIVHERTATGKFPRRDYYKCHRCSALFYTRSAIIAHTESHRKPSCRRCNQKFQSFEAREIHVGQCQLDRRNVPCCGYCGSLNCLKCRMKHQSSRKCQCCSREFSRMYSLRKHMSESHYDKRSSFCRHCSVWYPTRYLLIQHMKAKCVRPAVRKFRCRVCNLSLPTSSRYHMHRLLNHKTRNLARRIILIENKKEVQGKMTEKKERMVHRCGVCKVRCRSRSALTFHKRSKHREQVRCIPCRRHFQTKQKLSYHQSKYHSPVHYECFVCGVQLRSRYAIRQHVQLMHYVKYLCKVCRLGFESEQDYISHTTLHVFTLCDKCGATRDVCSGKCSNPSKAMLPLVLTASSRNTNRLECPICLRHFPSEFPHLLELHYLDHTKVGKLPVVKCELCQYSSHQRSELYVHMFSTHGSELPSCQDCSLTFTHREALDIHYIHCEHNKFQKKLVKCVKARLTCRLCDLRFPTSVDMAKHVAKTHRTPVTDNLACSACENTFNDDNDFLYHLQKDHPVVVVECGKCEEVFMDRQELESHESTAHPDPVPPVVREERLELSEMNETSRSAEEGVDNPADERMDAVSTRRRRTRARRVFYYEMEESTRNVEEELVDEPVDGASARQGRTRRSQNREVLQNADTNSSPPSSVRRKGKQECRDNEHTDSMTKKSVRVVTKRPDGGGVVGVVATRSGERHLRKRKPQEIMETESRPPLKRRR